MTYSSFLPDYVVRLLADQHGVLPLVQRADGVAVFADIVGFTSMSAALADVGPEGTEELSEILNSFFARMIDLVTGHGGTVAKFAGDALRPRRWPGARCRRRRPGDPARARPGRGGRRPRGGRRAPRRQRPGGGRRHAS